MLVRVSYLTLQRQEGFRLISHVYHNELITPISICLTEFVRCVSHLQPVWAEDSVSQDEERVDLVDAVNATEHHGNQAEGI